MANIKLALAVGSGITTFVGGGFGTYYLLQKQTIKDKLISKNLNLISSADDYQIVFRESKDTANFITLLNSINKAGESSVSSGSNITIGGEFLKKWCEASLGLSATERNITEILPNAEKYCVKTLFTIKDKMKKDNKKLIEDFSSKIATLKGLKEDTELQKEIEGINSTIKDLSTVADVAGEDALSKWCNSKIETDLTKDKENTLWTKIDKLCLTTGQ